MGTSSDGAVLLSRHGATYSANASEVCAYPELLERLLALVLRNFPSSLRGQGREALISRWNRDWGIEPEDLDRQRSAQANTNSSSFAAKSPRTSSSPFAPLQRKKIGSRGSIEPQAALGPR
jgi:hypothetical protein